MPLASPLRCKPSASSCIARLHLSSLLGFVDLPRATAALFVVRRRRCRVARASSGPHCSRPALTGALECTEASSNMHRRPIPPPHRSRLMARHLAASAHACLRAGPILTTRQARPLKWHMAFTPATGAWPNPSFEATSQRPLRALCAAPQLKRWAPLESKLTSRVAARNHCRDGSGSVWFGRSAKSSMFRCTQRRFASPSAVRASRLVSRDLSP